jgi:hypothetical protein
MSIPWEHEVAKGVLDCDSLQTHMHESSLRTRVNDTQTQHVHIFNGLLEAKNQASLFLLEARLHRLRIEHCASPTVSDTLCLETTDWECFPPVKVNNSAIFRTDVPSDLSRH